jgi:hypothetical protein
MPDVLWRPFHDNRPPAEALPALAANVLQGWVIAKHGIRVGVIAVLHTFNGPVEFNSRTPEEFVDRWAQHIPWRSNQHHFRRAVA